MASLPESDGTMNASFMEEFSCKICLEILQKPMQCQSNEHYFCHKCITQHLRKTATCPLCLETLTLETLRPAPRAITNIVSQFKIPRCDYVGRGCTDNVKVEDLVFHHEVCGFAPVECSNEGCCEILNRKDKESHEREVCKFRKTRCETCHEEIVGRDYEMHRCVLRKDIDEIKSCLAAITIQLKEFQEELKAHSRYIKVLQDPLCCVSSSAIRQERTIILNGQIVVAGGHCVKTSKSFEVFNWSTKSWTLFEDSLLFQRHHSFSFPFGKKVMICGGEKSKKIEYLHMISNPPSSVCYPVSLSDESMGKCARYGNRLFTFGNDVRGVAFNPSSWNINTKPVSLSYYRTFYGVECLGKSLVIVGGMKGDSLSDSVDLFDTTTKEIKELAPLPRKISKMATVCYQDNVIIIGGQNESDVPTNMVWMYDVNTKECKKLPSMNKGRSGCAAVIMEDVIIVMGGRSWGGMYYQALDTVEYYIIGHDSWEQLPSMHLAREGATACVYV